MGGVKEGLRAQGTRFLDSRFRVHMIIRWGVKPNAFELKNYVIATKTRDLTFKWLLKIKIGEK